MQNEPHQRYNLMLSLSSLSKIPDNYFQRLLCYHIKENNAPVIFRCHVTYRDNSVILIELKADDTLIKRTNPQRVENI